MKHHVRFTSRARKEFFETALWWAENRDVSQAARWIEEFEAAIAELADNPQRHALIREHGMHPWRYTYRRILFGLGRKPTHRAIFRIHDDAVYIVTIRHLHQADLTSEDVEPKAD